MFQLDTLSVFLPTIVHLKKGEIVCEIVDADFGSILNKLEQQIDSFVILIPLNLINFMQLVSPFLFLIYQKKNYIVMTNILIYMSDGSFI
jgi:hypothetical protein